MYLTVVPRAVAHGVVLGVELLGVETFPPLAFAIGLGELAIVIYAGFRTVLIVTLCGFVPGPGMVGMERDTQWQSGFLGSTGPAFEDILMRTDVLGVPLLILRIPQVEVVVVIAQYKEVLSTTTLVALHERLGIPLLGLEQGKDVLETELGRMTVVLYMVLVLTTTLDIHATSHPVARTFDTLRTPVGPDAELGIAEPFGCLVRL